MADFIVGSVAREEDFLFRKELIENLWDSLKKHNVLLLAPRRIGKTSVMYRMLDCPKKDWLVVHLNVEDLKTPGDFFITLVDAIQEHQPEYLRDTLVKGWDFLTKVFSKIQKIEVSDLKIELRKSEDLNEKWKEGVCCLLNQLSLSADGISRETLGNLYRQVEERKSGGRAGHTLNQAFQRLILYLQSDFYIEEVREDRYDFSSRLLKTWWKKYYGFENGGH